MRDWLHFEDHARALELIVRKGEPGQVYNVGADAEATNIDIVRAICGWMDQLVPDSPYRPHADLIAFVADRPGHDRRYAIDSTRVRKELGWRPGVRSARGPRTHRSLVSGKPLVVASDPRQRLRGSPASGSTGTGESSRCVHGVLLLGPNGQLGHDILRAHGKFGEPFDLLPFARDKLDVAETPGRSSGSSVAWTSTSRSTAPACTRVDEVEDNATLALAVNAHAVAAMAQVCAAKRARLVHICYGRCEVVVDRSV